jgi:hypothetical protein
MASAPSVKPIAAAVESFASLTPAGKRHLEAALEGLVEGVKSWSKLDLCDGPGAWFQRGPKHLGGGFTFIDGTQQVTNCRASRGCEPRARLPLPKASHTLRFRT